MEMKMDELIAKLEAAAEGSRELDADITVALDIRPEWLKPARGQMYVRRDGDRLDIAWLEHTFKRQSKGNPTAWYIWPHMAGVNVWPAFTTSVDAALTLVPEGWPQLQIIKTGALGDRTKVSIKQQSEYGWVDDPKPCDGYAATIPLALCIAALKARQA